MLLPWGPHPPLRPLLCEADAHAGELKALSFVKIKDAMSRIQTQASSCTLSTIIWHSVHCICFVVFFLRNCERVGPRGLNKRVYLFQKISCVEGRRADLTLGKAFTFQRPSSLTVLIFAPGERISICSPFLSTWLNDCLWDEKILPNWQKLKK